MLKVKTKLMLSPIHGEGCFADEFIPKGTTIWEYSNKHDTILTEKDLTFLPPYTQNEIKRFGWFSDGAYYLSGGNDRYMNHSSNPNTTIYGKGENLTSVANKDIKPDEEITCDYYKLDEKFNGFAEEEKVAKLKEFEVSE